MPKCQNCNAALSENAKFCGGCGSAITKRNDHCAKCGNKLSASDTFCGSCGNNAGNRQNNDQVDHRNKEYSEEQGSFDYYKQALSKYSDFSGRSTKAEYWYFVLYNIIIAALVFILGSIIGDEDGILYTIYLFIMLIPFWAVSVRRLHDIGKNGWILLASLIPLIGFIWMLILFTTDSDLGANKYGQNLE